MDVTRWLFMSLGFIRSLLFLFRAPSKPNYLRRMLSQVIFVFSFLFLEIGV
jgi:hypothetical protein